MSSPFRALTKFAEWLELDTRFFVNWAAHMGVGCGVGVLAAKDPLNLNPRIGALFDYVLNSNPSEAELDQLRKRSREETVRILAELKENKVDDKTT